ncbi:hypothetical protein C0995_013535 [Termitomyces sp. Mi166|nr:hypothetical protein C0995_013535 [Termitomyces sp. Mi166\
MTIPRESKSFDAEHSSTEVALTPEVITEMRKVDSSTNPLILPVEKVTSTWSSYILEKDNGQWGEWLYSMTLKLSMVQLWEYVFNQPPPPNAMYEPRANRAWMANNCLACSFVKRALSPSEQKLCAEEWDPMRLWAYLVDQHGGTVPVQQVRLLQEALTMKSIISQDLMQAGDATKYSPAEIHRFLEGK